MATITKGYTFGATETVTNTKLHTLVDSATITGIVNADIAAGAAIEGSKIDTGSLAYLTAGMTSTIITGVWEFQGQTYNDKMIASLITVGAINVKALTAWNLMASLASINTLNVVTANLKNLQVASLCSISNLYVSNINGVSYSGSTVKYTSGSGNWTCPSGVTTVYVTMVGGGGSGGSGANAVNGGGGGGGGGGGYVQEYPLTVVPANTYAYSVGSAGSDTTFAGVPTAKAGTSGADGVGTTPGAGGTGGGKPVDVTAGIGRYGVDGATPTNKNGGGGGGSPFGTGGAGATYNNGNGGNASGYGAGGGGGGGSPSTTYTGGHGTGGLIILRY